MIDRMDIDALLIGALYGELTPADEARLAAHLESHPADRNALAELTHTRAQIRESRVLAFQAEPPQGVSALLLQEAARRAPKRQRENEGWLQRFVRSLMAHPSLVTAATLVVVFGVAGTLYVRHGDKLAETSAQELASDTTRSSAAAAEPPAAAPAVAAEPPAQTAAAPEGAVAGPSAGASAGSGAYGVGLDEAKLRVRGAAGDSVAEKGSAERARGNADGVIARDLDKQAPSDDEVDRLVPSKTASAKSDKVQKKAAGIEVRTHEPEPKELKELEKNKRADAKPSYLSRNADEPAKASEDIAQAPRAVPASPPPPPKAEAAPKKPIPQPAPAAGPSNTGNTGARLDTKLNNSANVPGRKAAPNATSSSGNAGGSPGGNARGKAAGNAGGGAAQRNERPLADPIADPLADEQTLDGKDRANDAAVWARTKHKQVVALVKSSNCRAAATAAMEIYGRAPDYYDANVATDRSVKPCLAYLASERRREDRLRASKRANAFDDAQQQAAPPPAQAAPAEQQAAPPVKK
jgi:hypothetical protein